MSSAAVLVVLFVASAGMDPAAPALRDAARELLGETASIRLLVTPTDLPDAATLQRAGPADGVVELVWSDDRESALLHCYVAGDARWVDRRITFRANDEPPQRGRLLGFAIASMFSRLASAPKSAEPPRERLPTAPDSPPNANAKPQAPRLELELGANATTGVGGPANAVGAVVGMRLPLHRSLSLHAATGTRIGEIPAAQASIHAVTGAVGLAWRASPTDSAGHLGLRGDFIASWMDVTRQLAPGAGLESRARWTFGGAALFEGGYRFTGSLGAYAAAGTELVLTPTDVYTQGQLRAKLPTFRVVGELGVRACF